MPDDAFQQELTRRSLTPADMREGLRRELLTQKVIAQEVASKIAVTEQEVTAAFNANRAQFNMAEESYHLAQIVVTPARDAQVTNATGDDAKTPQAGGRQGPDADGSPQRWRIVPGSCDGLFRGSSVGAARRGSGLGAGVQAQAGPTGTARRGAQQGARVREHGQRGRTRTPSCWLPHTSRPDNATSRRRECTNASPRHCVRAKINFCARPTSPQCETTRL